MLWLLADEAVEIFGCILPFAVAGLLDDVGQCFQGFGRQLTVIPEFLQSSCGVIEQFGAA